MDNLRLMHAAWKEISVKIYNKTSSNVVECMTIAERIMHLNRSFFIKTKSVSNKIKTDEIMAVVTLHMQSFLLPQLRVQRDFFAPSQSECVLHTQP